MTRLFTRETWETGCTIAVEHTADNLHAHVELDDNVAIGPGDQVRVHGAAVHLPFGTALTLRRRATVSRASLIARWLTQIKAHLDLTELYEITFSSERIR